MTTLTPAATKRKKAKDAFSSPIASGIAIVIAVLWTIPTFSLLVTLLLVFAKSLRHHHAITRYSRGRGTAVHVYV